ncbi:hypothetical protein PFHG_00430 [Plasmodium falciparum HB3]|uniref:Uncharacterized protein n=1 Tax=Plasmodium falciparum (isolate HB3) TaxID=137071 RepID=A0A0L7K5W5_PLAFX|nr:hypothetical protein PFHG_00430 [Plasmodium falciparum HB3]
MPEPKQIYANNIFDNDNLYTWKKIDKDNIIYLIQLFKSLRIIKIYRFVINFIKKHTKEKYKHRNEWNESLKFTNKMHLALIKRYFMSLIFIMLSYIMIEIAIQKNKRDEEYLISIKSKRKLKNFINKKEIDISGINYLLWDFTNLSHFSFIILFYFTCELNVLLFPIESILKKLKLMKSNPTLALEMQEELLNHELKNILINTKLKR